MMQQLNSLDTKGPIDYDNLNIITRPRPRRRRQSGISLVPFRPYVKSLTSIREPFSFADGQDKWMTVGEKQPFFKQENARCIGSLMDDCDISDVIRWDIEGESTRLPMMCKLWMIVDGAVVERGKPHMVQDAAIQVLIAGRNLRSILADQQRYNQTSITTFDRRRRQSWHDVNEYHSVPYHQYTRSVRLGNQAAIQCDIANEHSVSEENVLSMIYETVDEDQLNDIEEHNAQEIIHNQSIPQDRVQISIMTQTEHQFVDKSTSIDQEFIQLFNLELQTNENLLSSIANPYNRHSSSNSSSEITTIRHKGIEYSNQSVSTGDDYPAWWLQLSTNVLLSEHITKQGEKKENILPPPPPSPRPPSPPRQLERSIQTDSEKGVQTEPEQTRSPRIQKSSSSVTIDNHYEIIDETDDGNNARRLLPFTDRRQRGDSHGDVDSRLSDYQTETGSNRDYDRIRQARTPSKQSDTGYETFALSLNQQSYSTPDHRHSQVPSHCSTNETKRRIRTKSSESTSTSVLATLLERYERTLQERQRAIAIVNDECLDIDDVLKRYRQKISNPTPTESTKAMQLYRDVSVLSSQSKEERPSSSVNHVPKSKYRSMPCITSDEMIQAYVPSPRILITDSYLTSSRQRQPRFDYCDLYLTDHSTSSAWIRYNEQRIDQLQRRIDLMLEIDDHEEAQLLFSTLNPITSTVSQRIDDLLLRKPKRRNQLTYYHDRIILPRRYNFRFPYRSNQSLPNSPRLLTRNLTRSTMPRSKSVRISTDHQLIPNQTRLREPTSSSKSVSRPVVSILRRNNTPLIIPPSRRLAEASHVWTNEIDGTVYILEQFSIPRYYRLYNDVSFREAYHFSRILETYLDHDRTSSGGYSSLIKNFALRQQLPTITSVA